MTSFERVEFGVFSWKDLMADIYCIIVTFCLRFWHCNGTKVTHTNLHSSELGLSPLLGIPLKKISSSPLFNKTFLRGLSSLKYSKSHLVHVRVVQRGVWYLFFYIFPWKSLNTSLLVQITHGLLSLLGGKRSKSGERSEPPFIIDPPLLGIPP